MTLAGIALHRAGEQVTSEFVDVYPRKDVTARCDLLAVSPSGAPLPRAVDAFCRESKTTFFQVTA